MLKNITKRNLCIGLGIAAALALIVFLFISVLGGETPVMKSSEKVPDSQIPTTILVWLEHNKQDEGYGAFYYDGYLYLAARMGQRPTGGFAVMLGEAELRKEELRVKVDYKVPNPWDMVTQVITYPRTVIRLAHSLEPPHTALFFSTSGSVIARVEVQNLNEE